LIVSPVFGSIATTLSKDIPLLFMLGIWLPKFYPTKKGLEKNEVAAA